MLEGVTGVALLVHPLGVVSLLLGSGPETAATGAVGRLAGAALVSLGMACWLVGRDGKSDAATGLVASMFLYNVFAAGLLAFGSVAIGLRSPFTWPAVVLHAAMAVWCVASLRVGWRPRRAG